MSGALEQVGDGALGVLLHVGLDAFCIWYGEDVTLQRLVDDIHELADVAVAYGLRCTLEVLQGIDGEQIEQQAVWHDMVTTHRLTLPGRVVALVEWVVATHILVE